MSEFNQNRPNEYATLSIYDFLETLVDAIRPSDTLRTIEPSINSEIKPGGFSEDIFIFLSDRERDEYSCGVCYSVLKDAHQCKNGHKFCYACIYVWSTSDRSAADVCPACRCEGVYARNEQINERLNRKRVKCHEENCNWRGFLCDFNEHKHRTYDFRELKNSVELPSLRTSVTIAALTEPVASREESSVTATVVEQQPLEPARPIVRPCARTPLAPRRLGRLGEATRTVGARPSNTVGGGTTNNINSMRSPPRRVASITPRLTRAASSTPLPLNTSVMESPLRRDSDSLLPILPMGRSLTSDSPMLPTPLTPPVTISGSSNNISNSSSVLEYRRLAPTYAARRRNVLSDGREQLAMMLILLTSDFDDRPSIPPPPPPLPPLSFQYSSSTDTPAQISVGVSSQDAIVATSRIGSGDQPAYHVNNSSSSGIGNRTGGRLGRTRLQEFRNLNRRLSEVANSLDRLIESTSRDTGPSRSLQPDNSSITTAHSNSESISDDDNNDDNV